MEIVEIAKNKRHRPVKIRENCGNCEKQTASPCEKIRENCGNCEKQTASPCEKYAEIVEIAKNTRQRIAKNNETKPQIFICG